MPKTQPINTTHNQPNTHELPLPWRNHYRIHYPPCNHHPTTPSWWTLLQRPYRRIQSRFQLRPQTCHLSPTTTLNNSANPNLPPRKTHQSKHHLSHLQSLNAIIHKMAPSSPPPRQLHVPQMQLNPRPWSPPHNPGPPMRRRLHLRSLQRNNPVPHLPQILPSHLRHQIQLSNRPPRIFIKITPRRGNYVSPFIPFLYIIPP